MRNKKNKKIYIFETPYDYHGLSEVIVIASNLEEAVEKVVKKITESTEFTDYHKEGVLEFFQGKNIPKYKIVEDLDDFFYLNQGCDC